MSTFTKITTEYAPAYLGTPVVSPKMRLERLVELINSDSPNMEEIEALVDSGIDLNAVVEIYDKPTPNKGFPLWWAAAVGNTAIVVLLLDKGTTAHSYLQEAVKIAVYNGFLSTVQLILNAMTASKQKAIKVALIAIASSRAQPEILDWILENVHPKPTAGLRRSQVTSITHVAKKPLAGAGAPSVKASPKPTAGLQRSRVTSITRSVGHSIVRDGLATRTSLSKMTHWPTNVDRASTSTSPVDPYATIRDKVDSLNREVSSLEIRVDKIKKGKSYGAGGPMVQVFATRGMGGERRRRQVRVTEEDSKERRELLEGAWKGRWDVYELRDWVKNHEQQLREQAMIYAIGNEEMYARMAKLEKQDAASGACTDHDNPHRTNFGRSIVEGDLATREDLLRGGEIKKGKSCGAGGPKDSLLSDVVTSLNKKLSSLEKKVDEITTRKSCGAGGPMVQTFATRGMDGEARRRQVKVTQEDSKERRKLLEGASCQDMSRNELVDIVKRQLRELQSQAMTNEEMALRLEDQELRIKKLERNLLKQQQQLQRHIDEP